MAEVSDHPIGDAAFDEESMTTGGRFRARRSGIPFVTIRTGTHARTIEVTVGK